MTNTFKIVLISLLVFFVANVTTMMWVGMFQVAINSQFIGTTVSLSAIASVLVGWSIYD